MTPEGSDTFEGLLRSLSAVHDSQQRVIKTLTDENARLREQAAAAGEAKHPEIAKDISGDDSSIEVVVNNRKIPEVENVLPILPLDEKNFTVDGEGSSRGQSEEWVSELPPETPSMPARTPSGWPTPELWEEWSPRRGETIRHVITRNTISHLCVVEDTTGQAMTMVNHCYQRLIIKPNSLARLTWDFLSSLMVCYDVITIPLMAISLDPTNVLGGNQGDFTYVMDWITTSFWTLDIPWSFLTGYHTEGVVEMRAYHVFKNYVKTWCAFDTLVVLIDWVIVYEASVGRSAHTLGLFRVGKTARMARILRAVRLLRFVKLQRAVVEALELINSETIRAGLNILLAVLFIFAINHYLACGWFFVGHFNWSMGVKNWIVENNIPDHHIAYAYVTSLHWSLTQFTPASMEIRPFNLLERVYAILCLMFALITFSSFLGSITASITQLRKHTTEAGRQQAILRAYFHKNKVSSQLSKNIWTFLVKNHFSQKTRSHKSQIQVLELLPHHLLSLLHQELYSPYITRAPFFYHYVAFSSDAVMEVCHQAVTERCLVRNDVLFQDGKVGEKMFFTASGALQYHHHDEYHNQSIGTGSWVAEAVLWVKWVHVAALTALSSAEIIAVDSAKFRAAAGLFKHSLPFVKTYARLFHEYLEGLGKQNQTDLLTDVGDLEGITRRAWFDVSSAKDKDLYSDMPQHEFPKLSRTERVRSLMWQEPVKVPLWRRASKFTTRISGSLRLSRLESGRSQG